ncbi:MAG: hypothetical protein KGN02_05245 [bacterium]|nr:hypothetical protein [bacterium]
MSDRRNYELHRLVATKVQRDPSLLRIALRNIARFENRSGSNPYYLRWKEIIASGPESTVEALLDTGELGQTLRSASPFAGILTDEERLTIIRDVAAAHRG